MSADANQERKKGQHYTTTDDNLLVLREYGAHVLYVRTCVQNKHTRTHILRFHSFVHLRADLTIFCVCI